MPCTSCQEYGTTHFLRFSNPKNHTCIIFQIYMDFSATYQSSPRKMTYHFKSNAIKKMNSTYSEATKNKMVQTIPFVNANRYDDARSCPGTAVHASGASQSLPSPFVPASENCGHDRKDTTVESRQTHGKTSKQNRRQNIPIFRKVMISLLTSPGRTTCFARLPKPSSFAAAASLLVSQTSREQRLVVKYR